MSFITFSTIIVSHCHQGVFNMPALTTDLFHKSQQYLRSAAVLLELGDYDSSVSRAYFAMFYITQGLLLETNGEFSTKRGIRATFRKQFVEGGTLPEQAGDMLDRAYQMYERADYSSRAVTTREAAEQALQEAEAFVNAISQHLELSE